MQHAEAGRQKDDLGTTGGLVVAGREADRQALVTTLKVSRLLLAAARAALREGLPERRHHRDRRREDAIGALCPQELEDHLGAVQHSTFRHGGLRSCSITRLAAWP